MRSWLYLLLTSGCGFSTGGGGAVAIDSQVPGDAGPDATLIASDAALDGSQCFGTGFGRTCIAQLPSQPRTFGDPQINTDTGCTEVIGGLCVITATNVDVPTGASVRALGSRPLVVVATGTITIAGTIGASSLASSPASGAGSSTSGCATPAAATNDAGGAAGGAGGSFGGTGGSGGNGDLNDTGLPTGPATGQGAAAPVTPTTIRAGCSGGAGGTGVGQGGAGGRGGGAIYFIAGTSITVAATGRVYAVGEGGRGANNLGGGGGAGSGGLLAFDAPMITLAGNVIANGGGGGEGAGLGGNVNGDAGSDGVANGARASGGVSGTNGGNGGDSSGGGSPDGNNGEAVNEGGGGGGGGAGFIYIKGTYAPSGSTISPSPSVTP